MRRKAEQGLKQLLQSLKISLFYSIFTLKQIEHVVLPLPMRKLPGAAMDNTESTKTVQEAHAASMYYVRRFN